MYYTYHLNFNVSSQTPIKLIRMSNMFCILLLYTCNTSININIYITVQTYVLTPSTFFKIKITSVLFNNSFISHVLYKPKTSLKISKDVLFQQVKNVNNNNNSIFYTHQIKDRYQIRAAFYKFKELLL